jgi:hypothetical protein
MNARSRKVVRCATYTRVSTDQGLEQDFNSLDAQYDASQAYIRSQAHATVYWEGEGFPGYVAVAIGSFADPNFPAPTISVWEESRHPWVSLPPDTPPKRVAKQG